MNFIDILLTNLFEIAGRGNIMCHPNLKRSFLFICASLVPIFSFQNCSNRGFEVSSVITTQQSSLSSPSVPVANGPVDSTLPTLSFTQTPVSSTSNSATFVFSASDAGSGIMSIECSLDNVAFAVCVSPVNLTNLAASIHSYRVQAKDKVGNASLITHNWTITPTVPTSTPTSTPTAGGAIWAVGTCGHVEKSFDNGVTFQEVTNITTIGGKSYDLQNYGSCSDSDHGAPSLYGLAYGNGRLIMATWAINSTLGSATTNQIRLYSDDKGATWQEFAQTSILGQAFWKISYSTIGKFFLGSTHYGDSRVLKSTDGVNWTAAVSGCTTDPVCKFRASAAAGNYFIVGGDGNNFFSGPVGDPALTPSTLGASRDISSGSRISTSSDHFGVIGVETDTIAVVDGLTGYSAAVKLSVSVSGGLFNASDKIFYTNGNSIYRADLNCSAQNSCSGLAVKIATMTISAARMWYLNGYLYAVGPAGGRIYRSNDVFDPNSSNSTVSFVMANSNTTPLPAQSLIKEMVYAQ